MVLGLGDQDLVAFAQVLAAPGVGDEVYGFGRAAGEDKAPDVWRAQKPSHLLAGAFVEGCGLLGQAVDTAVDVGVVHLVVLVEGVQHLPRFLGGCGIVEVDELLFAHPTIQDGKVFAHFPYVIHFSLPPAISNGPRLLAPRPSESSRAAAPGPIASSSSSHPGQGEIGEPSRSLRVGSGILSNTTRHHPTSMPRSDRHCEDEHEPHHWLPFFLPLSTTHVRTRPLRSPVGPPLHYLTVHLLSGLAEPGLQPRPAVIGKVSGYSPRFFE